MGELNDIAIKIKYRFRYINESVSSAYQWRDYIYCRMIHWNWSKIPCSYVSPMAKAIVENIHLLEHWITHLVVPAQGFVILSEEGINSPLFKVCRNTSNDCWCSQYCERSSWRECITIQFLGDSCALTIYCAITRRIRRLFIITTISTSFRMKFHAGYCRSREIQNFMKVFFNIFHHF